MIPDFDDAGNLPPGVHDAGWDEIAARFAASGHRLAVYGNVRGWARHMMAAGCSTIYLDGSFITIKPLPADFDACWDIRGVDRSKLASCLIPKSLSDEQTIKATFGGDIKIDYASPPGSISTYLNFFMPDGRNNRRPKGVLWIALRPA